MTTAAATFPGSAWNAGVRATSSEYVVLLNAGDCLDRDFHAACGSRLDGQSSVDLVTTDVLWIGPGAVRETQSVGACAIADLVGNSDLTSGASMFRRSVWDSLGRLDETLPCLEVYEFWLRAFAAGLRGEGVNRPLLIRMREVIGLYRDAWTQEARAEAIASITRRHAASFERDPVEALRPREKHLHELGRKYRATIARREAARAEIESLKQRASVLRESEPPGSGLLHLGEFRRTTPISNDWGFDRGTPIDRHYIEEFLDRHAPDIRGVVLEVQDGHYTQRFGGDRVTRGDVLDLDPANPGVTIVSDLRCAANIAAGTYDCVVLTQTVHLIDDIQAVIRECERILKPGGILLATLPSASRVSLEYGQDGDFWRVTAAGARRLFGAVFPAHLLQVTANGNVFVNAAFLYGLASEELTDAEFAATDPYFPLVVTVRAQKPAVVPSVRWAPQKGGRHGAAILMYHRVANVASDVHGLAVSPEEFRHQLAVLTDRYKPMSLEDLAEAARSGEVPPGAVALTFDDGYIDNLTNASPLLGEFGVPASFFLTTEGLEAGDPYFYWWDVLERAILAPRDVWPHSLTVDLPGGERTFATLDELDRRAAHQAIYEAVVGSPPASPDAVVNVVRKWASLGGDVSSRRMSRDEIATLAGRRGHAIGAHSIRHLMLPNQAPDLEFEEIAGSRKVLEALVGQPVRAFAYPFGACSDSTVRAAAAAGFDRAVTCEQTPLTVRSHRLRLPRLDVAHRDGLRFEDWLAIHLTTVIPR